MRTPTPLDALYRWHRAALAGRAPSAHADDPQCGWFKRKLVKGGVFVPARIWMYQPICAETGELIGDEALQCEVNGRYADPLDAWSWLCGNPIAEQEFRYLSARIDYAAQYEPADPFAAPGTAIDLNRTPLHF